MKFILYFSLILSGASLAQEDKSTTINTTNKVDSTETLDFRYFYATKLEKALAAELLAIKKQNQINKEKGVIKKKINKRKSKPKPKSLRPNIKVIALYENGALINDKGFRRSIKVNEKIGSSIVKKITPYYLLIAHKNRNYKYTVK